MLKALYGLFRPISLTLLTTAMGVMSLPGPRQAVQLSLRPPNSPLAAYWLGEELMAQPRRVLAVTCHPDDLAFFCSGTLDRLRQAGSEIHALVLSDGEKGGQTPDLGTQRRAEEQTLAELLGFASLTFIGLPDYGLAYEPRMLPTIASAWQRLKPDVVFGFDPKELVPGSVNRDHQALGQGLLDLVGHPKASGARLYFYGSRHPNVLVDIAPVMERKVNSIMQYRSQTRYIPRNLYPYLTRLYANLCGAGITRYAEALYRVV